MPGTASVYPTVREAAADFGEPDRVSHISKMVLSTVKYGGAEGTRTPDFLNAIEALSQLSYSPTRVTNIPEAHHRRNRGPL